MVESWKISFADLESALERFQEVMEIPLSANTLVVDAAMQRFEFTFELFWKNLKHLLATEGKETTFPKEALREAYAGRWIEDETLWLKMLQDRNLTSHTYRQDLAKEIYGRLPSYLAAMLKARDKLKDKFV